MAGQLSVLFLTAWYPSAGSPGAGIFVREQAQAAARFDRVAVLHAPGLAKGLPRRWQFDVEEDPALTGGLPTYRVRHRLSPVPKTSYLLHLWSVWRAYRQIVRRGFRPDVIHAHTYEIALPAVMLGWLVRRPVVLTEHSSAFMSDTLTPASLRRVRRAFPRARRVIAVSRALQRAIERHGVRASFEVVPNTVDTELFHPAVRRRRPGDPYRLLFVGSLTPVKGVPTLLEAASQLDTARVDWELQIVGDGPWRADYERLVMGLHIGGPVNFLGFLPKPELARCMQEADCLVSASYVETFGVAVAEALASGLPVLATRSGGPEEFVDEQSGILVPPGDAAALAQGLVAMLARLDRPDGFDRAAIAARAAARFGPTTVGARLDAIYRAVTRR